MAHGLKRKKQENKETPHPKHKDPLRCPRHRKNPPYGYQGGGANTDHTPSEPTQNLDPQEPMEGTNGKQKKKGNLKGVGW